MDIPIDYSWSFGDKTQRDTGYGTHSFHKYPAKFIPHLAERIIKRYSKRGDLVCDVFAGCGTTLVESKILGRQSIGVDINDMACLIMKAKVTPIKAEILRAHFSVLSNRIDEYKDTGIYKQYANRVLYWFDLRDANKLEFLLSAIKNEIKDDEIQTFFLCSFSNILKGVSIWAQKSNKPTRDMHKKVSDPFKAFRLQVNKMIKGMEVFYSALEDNGTLNIPAEIQHACSKDLRNVIKDSSVDLIITSPPYASSYEYADLHQLSLLWLDGTSKELRDFRKKFVGSSTRSDEVGKEDLSYCIVSALETHSKKLAGSVAGYFKDMRKTFEEMNRILKPGGKAAVVIGNTQLKGVPILNAEVFLGYLKDIGMREIEIIKREIPMKNIPSVRDPKTGRFTKITNPHKILSYPTEYILICEKQGK